MHALNYEIKRFFPEEEALSLIPRNHFHYTAVEGEEQDVLHKSNVLLRFFRLPQNLHTSPHTHL